MGKEAIYKNDFLLDSLTTNEITTAKIKKFVFNRTAVGIVCKDGVVLAVEKIVTSKLYEPGVNKRIFIIDQHIGMVCFMNSF